MGYSIGIGISIIFPFYPIPIHHPPSRSKPYVDSTLAGHRSGTPREGRAQRLHGRGGCLLPGASAVKSREQRWEKRGKTWERYGKCMVKSWNKLEYMWKSGSNLYPWGRNMENYGKIWKTMSKCGRKHRMIWEKYGNHMGKLWNRLEWDHGKSTNCFSKNGKNHEHIHIYIYTHLYHLRGKKFLIILYHNQMVVIYSIIIYYH